MSCMNIMHKSICLLILFVIVCTPNVFAQEGVDTLAVQQAELEKEQFKERLRTLVDSTLIRIDVDQLPDKVLQTISSLNMGNTDARTLLRGMASTYNLNLVVDNALRKEITASFYDITVIEALINICQQNNLELVQRGGVFRIKEYVVPPKEPEIIEPTIDYSDQDGLSVDLDNVELALLTRTLSQKTGQNILVRNGVRGAISGYLQNIELETGLETLLNNNGFSLREKDGVYVVDRIGINRDANGQQTGGSFWVSVEEGKVSMDVVAAKVTDVVREIQYQSDLNMVIYGLPDADITAKISDVSIDESLNYLFKGTGFTFRKDDENYIIGGNDVAGIASTKLIRMEHLRAEVVDSLLPKRLKDNAASVQVITEQNGLMVIGTNDIILEVEDFIQEIDFPTPQILIEALVLDVQTSKLEEFGFSLAQGLLPDSSFLNPFTGLFGQATEEGSQSGGLLLQGSGTDLNNAFSSGGNLFGISNLGRLPSDFFFRVQALSRDGVANIRSRPQVSTLNGHTASIEVGTTQYFLLESTSVQGSQQIVSQQSQNFTEIEANVLLEITPYVNASGEVTAEIHPEFNTPVGGFDPNVPPTINKRVLDSTVRLKDGETIILGGLIQESETKTANKVPILGDIPLLGRLFRNKSTSLVKSELIIFITPHVFYGDGTDNERWNKLSKEISSTNNN